MFPIDDWQFYLVTAIALGGLWLLLRPFIRRKAKSGCGSCAVKHPTK